MSKYWTRRDMLTAMGAFALVPLLPRAARSALPELAGPTMGTRYRVRIEDAPVGLHLPKLKRAVEQVLETTDRLMSTHRPDSELTRFNTSTSKTWQIVSAPTARVLEAA
ncbi:MAG: FAD:protein FMN transferase, partial [Gammaproteobacteria bacterium]